MKHVMFPPPRVSLRVKPHGTALVVMSLLAVLLICFPAGCEGPGGQSSGQTRTGQSSDSGQEAVSGPPVYGGRFVEPMLGDATNLLSMLTSDAGSHAIAQKIYMAPLKYNKNIELVPWAAETFEVLDDGKLLRFTLRKDIRWADGEPFTARDVEFTYKMMIDPKTPTPYSGDYLAVKEFRRTGEYSFEVEYEKVYARALVTWALEIYPEHLLKHEDLTDTKYSRHPVGNGPYELTAWEAGSNIVLEASDDYCLGRPYIDQFVYKVIPDLGTQFLELKAGNVDTMALTPKQYLFQTTGPEWDNNFNKFKYLSFGYEYLGYNLKRPMFQDRRVRQALTLAIDKQELVKGVLFGLGVPAMGPYKPGTWVYNDKLEPYGYDPERALKLLHEAGWMDTDGDGLLDKDGKPFAFTILTNQGNTERIKSATIIQHRLKDVGIRVSIRTVEWAAFVKEFVNPGRFDALLLGWNILQDPDIYTVWHSSMTHPKGLNHTFYANAELDDLIVRARQTLDQAERKKMYDRVQEILHKDQPYTFLYIPYSLPIVQARIQNISEAPAGITYNQDKWWVPKPLQRFAMPR